jgi:hypothetical protein
MTTQHFGRAGHCSNYIAAPPGLRAQAATTRRAVVAGNTYHA